MCVVFFMFLCLFFFFLFDMVFLFFFFFLFLFIGFFFFKQKTAYEMRISDWSSDVCSSDLFAVALLDSASRTLWLGRDRFGVKPLYWAALPGGFAFASQPRALLASGEIAATPNRGFVARIAASH